MPYLIKVGREDKNLNGYTSKGYFIRISKKQVYKEYGSINTNRRKFYWAGVGLPVKKWRHFNTKEESNRSYQRMLKIRARTGYDKLKPNTRIYKRSILKP